MIDRQTADRQTNTGFFYQKCRCHEIQLSTKSHCDFLKPLGTDFPLTSKGIEEEESPMP